MGTEVIIYQLCFFLLGLLGLLAIFVSYFLKRRKILSLLLTFSGLCLLLLAVREIYLFDIKQSSEYSPPGGVLFYGEPLLHVNERLYEKIQNTYAILTLLILTHFILYFLIGRNRPTKRAIFITWTLTLLAFSLLGLTYDNVRKALRPDSLKWRWEIPDMRKRKEYREKPWLYWKDKNQPERAIQFFERRIESSPNCENHLLLAEFYAQELGNAPKAQEIYESFLFGKPLQGYIVSCVQNLKLLYHKSGNSKAEESLLLSVAKRTRDSYFIDMLINYYYDSRQEGNAKQLLQDPDRFLNTHTSP